MRMPANSFLIDFYCRNEFLLSLNVEHWNEYIATLKAADSIKIEGSTYSVKEIIMEHKDVNGTLTVQVIVNLR